MKNIKIPLLPVLVVILVIIAGFLLWVNAKNTTEIDFKLILSVGLPTVIWLIIVLAYLWKLTRRFLLEDSGKSNPYKKETMGLPRGTIRGILTLTLLVVVILLQFYLMNNGTIEKANTLINAFELMLAFYFGSKVMHHLAATDKYKTTAVAASKKAVPTAQADFEDSEAEG